MIESSMIGLAVTATFDVHATARIFATGLVDCLLEGTVIAVFAACLLKLGRGQSAGTRFAAWFSALMAISALPVFRIAWPSGQAGSMIHPAIHRAAINVPGSWAIYLFTAWAALAAFSLARVAAGLWQLHGLRKNCEIVDPRTLELDLRETLERHRAVRPVALCVSDDVQVPTALGLVKPAVVIPRWLMRELPPAELKQIVLHELAHLRRWDDWTNLAQKIARALLFFHPAAWWIENKVSLEREMACDDAVLAETASPRAYAECLAHLAEKSFVRRSVALAQAAVGRIRQTSLRVARILDVNRPAPAKYSWKPAAALIVACAIASAVGISKAPRLVAFDDTPSHSSTPRAANMYTAQITNVGVKPSEIARVNVGSAPAKPRVVQARNKRPSIVSSRSGYVPVSLTNKAANQATDRATDNVTDKAPQRGSASGLLHMTNFRGVPAAAPEAWFVVVESQEYDSAGNATFRMSVWRVIVQPSDQQVNKIPHKET